MKVVYVIAVVFLLCCVGVYVVAPTPGLTDFLAAAAAFLAFAGAVYAWLRLRTTKEGIVWLLLVIGLLLWLGGETLWLILEAVTQEVPYPSVADVSWLLAYPVLFYALYLEYKRLDVDLGKKKYSIFLVVAAAGILMVWALLYPIAVSDEVSTVEKFLDIAYPIGDLALLYVALLVTAMYLGGQLGRAWLLISVGFILYAVADLAFSYLQWEEIYWSGHPVDLLWMIGDTIVFVGATMYRYAYEKLV